MNNWSIITKLLSFTGVKEESVWQDLFFSVLAIPLAVISINKIITWWNNIKPSRLLFETLRDNHRIIYIFHSQMSGADNAYNFNPDQKYITRYPHPLPTNHSNLGTQKKCNVDPVISEAETECMSDVYNILGTIGKVKNIKIGSLIQDWGVWSSPMFTIGFNPKTIKLIEKCRPIHFQLNMGELLVKKRFINMDQVYQMMQA